MKDFILSTKRFVPEAPTEWRKVRCFRSASEGSLPFDRGERMERGVNGSSGKQSQRKGISLNWWFRPRPTFEIKEGSISFNVSLSAVPLHLPLLGSFPLPLNQLLRKEVTSYIKKGKRMPWEKGNHHRLCFKWRRETGLARNWINRLRRRFKAWFVALLDSINDFGIDRGYSFSN